MRATAALYAACVVACQAGATAPPRGKLEIVDAPVTTDVAGAIAPLIAAAAQDHKRVVVYVGASWCEPCRYFHDAAVAGRLDDRLGDVRLVAFDLDRDRDALAASGYASEMIPLFALPAADGRASGKQISGSIKGDGAADQIAPRLRALVDAR